MPACLTHHSTLHETENPDRDLHAGEAAFLGRKGTAWTSQSLMSMLHLKEHLTGFPCCTLRIPYPHEEDYNKPSRAHGTILHALLASATCLSVLHTLASNAGPQGSWMGNAFLARLDLPGQFLTKFSATPRVIGIHSLESLSAPLVLVITFID